jgi:hypothetical protein
MSYVLYEDWFRAIKIMWVGMVSLVEKCLDSRQTGELSQHLLTHCKNYWGYVISIDLLTDNDSWQIDICGLCHIVFMVQYHLES